jgi:uncharacterized protein YbjT (DUF2867 family)
MRRVLEEEGASLRCMVRRPEALLDRVADRTEVVGGDVMDRDSLVAAMRGIDVAYYLIHSMSGQGDFASADRDGARNFAEAAAEAGVGRIIYLGGLGRADADDLSPHLASRHEVGRILREGTVPVIELRSSIILGSGSLSFELIRALVDRLPVMTTPRWVSVRTQPISIEDVLQYLLRAASIPVEASAVYEIGGRERVSYADIMREYANQRGLTRRFIPLPVLSPRLSSLWLGLITPLYARIGRELIDGVRNETIVEHPVPEDLFGIRPRGLSAAIRRALVNEDLDFAETRWCDALSSSRAPRSWGGDVRGSRIVDSRAVYVEVSPRAAFTPIRRVGGETGWYAGNWLWKLRGAIDLLVGGVGLRRGRRDSEHVSVGEPLDFWRVESYEPDRLLRLHAEMRLPGRAWLQFEVEPDGSGCLVRQTALFKPRGLFGLLYWYGLYPIHAAIFGGMLRRIASLATDSEIALGNLEPPKV